MTVPDFLPSLAAGAHDADAGEACVMEYISLLAGEQWSDRPECTHPLLAHEARTANDLLPDGERQRLIPLIGRLLGTNEDSGQIRAHLRLTQTRSVAVLLDPTSRSRVQTSIDRATGWLGRDGDASDIHAAISEAAGFSIDDSPLDPAHADFHITASRIFAFALSPELESAEAWALTALVQAHRIAASGECRADCGDQAARGRRMVKDLGALIDSYDAVTGRRPRTLAADDIRELIHTLG